MSRIMIVEDDLSISNMLKEVLPRAGYEVICAYSGTEALLLLEKTRPDLILLDLMLPGLTGEEVLPKLKGIPVIITSAKSDTKSKIDMLTDGDLKIGLSPDGTASFENSAKDLDAVQTAHLFDRFFTVNTARGGTGLGLSIAKLLTEKMDGSIAAQYRKGKLSICVLFPNN